MGDSLNSLPVDQIPLKDEEKQIAEMLFQQKETTFQKYWQPSKIYIIATILVFLMLLPFFDKVMFKLWGRDDSKLVFAMLKSFIFLILLIIISYITSK